MKLAVALTASALLACATQAQADRVRARLTGLEEVPALSTPASGKFQARIRDSMITYELSYENLEGAVAQAHIHFGQKGVNAGISVFLCTNLGNGPAGTQPCPPAPAKITGVIQAGDIVGPGAQGIAAGEIAELIEAIDNATAYVNVHTDKYPGGEVRGQLDD